MTELDEDTDQERSWCDGLCYACDLWRHVDNLGPWGECKTELLLAICTG